MRKFVPLYAMIFAAIVLAAFAISPPRVSSPNTPANEFSSARAMVDVREISAAPHMTGTPENVQVRDYLGARLTALGFEVSLSKGELNKRALARLNRWSGQERTRQEFVNIIGVRHGTNPNLPALLFMAHHDTVWGSPGAADATIGLASILEIARTLQEAPRPPRDLIVLFTDAEELGLNGARQFFKSHPLADRIGAVINFEARGGGGTANMFQTSAGNSGAARLYARAVREPSTSSLSTFVYSVLPNDTDLTPALERDYTAYNFANIGAAKYYHSPKITAEALDERSLQHMGSQGLDLTRALLSSAPLPKTANDASFFDVFGFFTLVFAPFWGWVFLLLAVVSLGLSAPRERPVKVTARDIAIGAAKMLALIIIGGGALYGLNILSGAGGNYYDRLAAIPKLEFMTATLCGAVFFALFGRGGLPCGARIGIALPLLALGLVLQLYAPTASYFLTIPVMLYGLTVLAKKKLPSERLGTLTAVVFGALVMGYMIGLGHLLMLGVGPDLPSLAIIIMAAGSLFLLPLYQGLSKRAAYGLAAIFFALSLAQALFIRLDPIASTIALY